MNIDKLLQDMTVTEKALLCSGRNFWFVRGIKKYGIKPYMVTDGPHGLRKQADNADNLGLNDSVKATCFPVAAVMANTWDRELIAGVGEKIAEEALEERVGIVLGPGANIKRSPLCGRNFEYYSEDPYLSGNCAAAFIKGVQGKGVGTSLKHYAFNNQEGDRLRVNAVVDERAMREIYLASFERAVKESQPYTIMCAYNRVNGDYAAENRKLLTEILRDEWGFKGYVMTDWGAINDRAKGITSGTDLEMPGGSGEGVSQVVKAVEEGRLSEADLNKAVRRLLEINLKVHAGMKEEFKYDREAHHEYARKVAAEGAVLLKNNNGALPINKDDKLTVIGSLFDKPRYQGNGSSLIKPHKLVSPKEAFDNEGICYTYSEGYSDISDKEDAAAIGKAVEAAKAGGEKVLFFGGLTKFYESEGFDRTHMRMPDNQIILLDKLSKLGKKIIVILYGGAPVEMPWIQSASAVLNMYLPGEAVGEATLDVLMGQVNPSGKLSESYPVKFDDNPSYNYFPEGPVTVEYRESIFVGYRYYTTAAVPVLFPFGHGLSYTDFRYSDLKVDSKELKAPYELKVSCKVKNIGKLDGKEVIQLYVRKKDSEIQRADRELKGFTKLMLKAGESGAAEFILDERAFSYYNIKTGKFEVEGGEYEILIGASSLDIRLSESVTVEGTDAPVPYTEEAIGEYKAFKGMVSDNAFTEILGSPIPSKAYEIKPIRLDTITAEARVTVMGRFLYFGLNKGVYFAQRGKDENSVLMRKFMRDLMSVSTMRSLANSNGGALSPGMVDGLITVINGKICKGLRQIMKARKFNKEWDRKLLEIEGWDYKKL